MFKTFLIIFLILAVFAVGGGGFYYFEIYQPQTYAALLLSLYQKLEHIGLQPDTSSLKNKADYENTLTILEKRIGLLESIQNELARAQAPKRMESIKKEFADYVSSMQAQHVHAIQLASFITKGSELQNAIKSVYDNHALEQNNIKTVGDLQTFLGPRIDRIQTAATQLFNKEITERTNPSFAELSSLWKNASPIFDVIFKKIKTMSPNLPMSLARNLSTPSEAEQINAYNKHLEEFIKKLEHLITQYSAYDILVFHDSSHISSTEASERALEFYQRIQTLKEQYAQ